jgi:hypothetical protein
MAAKINRKVIGFVLVMLVGCEIILALMDQSFSVNIRHIHSIPFLADKIKQQTGISVLFMGNSLIRYGLDPGVFRDEIYAKGVGPIHFERVFPDASSIREWRYAFKHFFLDRGHIPDVLVVNFSGSHLEDQQKIRPSDLAAFYASVPDIPRIFAEDVRAFGDRAEFLLAYFFRLFAYRETISKRILDMVVPHYQSTLTQINATMRDGASKEHVPTYHTLERFSVDCLRRGVHLILVAMPLQHPYKLDPGLPGKARELGITFIDARDVEGLTVSRFIDSMHMDQEGAILYTRTLAGLLANLFNTVREAQHRTSPVLQGKRSRGHKGLSLAQLCHGIAYHLLPNYCAFGQRYLA